MSKVEERVELEQPDSGNALDLSDEDIAGMSFQEFEAKVKAQGYSDEREPDSYKEPPPSEPEVDVTDQPEQESSEVEESIEGPSPYDVPTPVEDTEPEEPDSEEDVSIPEDEPELEEFSQDELREAVAIKRELFKKFKAAGRDIQINSVEDARRLMQMGVDYGDKMKAMKPRMKIIRVLEKNGLLDETKINHWIEMERKVPEAIRKFIKEKGIDPMELDLSDDDTNYTPRTYMPSDEEANVEEVLESIRGSKAYERTIEEIGNKWDAVSRDVFLKQPELIRVINEHIELGVYDQIMNVIENERLLGRLQGVPDLEAYKMVGNALQTKGGFAHLANSKPAGKPAQSDRKLKARKRAAGPSRTTGAAKAPSSEINPLSLSDAEFEKMVGSRA